MAIFVTPARRLKRELLSVQLITGVRLESQIFAEQALTLLHKVLCLMLSALSVLQAKCAQITATTFRIVLQASTVRQEASLPIQPLNAQQVITAQRAQLS